MKTQRKIKNIAKGLINNDKTFCLFEECLDILVYNNAKMLDYFELIHEFGHLNVAVELGATIKEVKINNILFKINKQLEIEFVSFEKDNQSYCTLYFMNEQVIDTKLEMVARGGLFASTKALKYSFPSFKVLCFNFVNSNYWFLPKKDSDKDLAKLFRDKDFALQFNEKWKNNYHMDIMSM